jgi:sulfate permease, SulP family
MINVKISGARTRISTFLAGSLLLALVVGLGGLVAKIPMAALVAVMIMVSVATMDWHSVHPKTLRHMPKSETFVMLCTVAVTVATDNLACGVGVGTLAAMVLFVRRVAHVTDVVDIDHPDENTRVYAVKGELFFASSNDLVYQFDYVSDPANVVIDMSAAHIWDASSVATLDAITEKYASKGKTVTLVGMNDHSAQQHAQLTGRLVGAH